MKKLANQRYDLTVFNIPAKVKTPGDFENWLKKEFDLGHKVTLQVHLLNIRQLRSKLQRDYKDIS